MNKLVESMAKIVDMATTGISNGVDMLIKQAPDIVHQFLLYKSIVAWATGIGLLLISVVVLTVAIYLTKLSKKITAEYDDTRIMLKFISILTTWFISTIVLWNTLIGAFNNFMQAIYIMVAPKVYLIEFFSALIKK